MKEEDLKIDVSSCKAPDFNQCAICVNPADYKGRLKNCLWCEIQSSITYINHDPYNLTSD